MISVIIPTLNEVLELPETLRRARASAAAHELIVADGGSVDETIAISRAAGARVVQVPVALRAVQMNAGARVARGETLLFLHADTWLNEGSLDAVAAILETPRVLGGAFARRFRDGGTFLDSMGVLSDMRGRTFGMFLGDQAIFVRKRTFEALGGFPLIAPFEDVEFSLALRNAGPTVLLTPPIRSSARRFETLGPVRRSWGDFVLTLGFLKQREAKAQQERASGSASEKYWDAVF